MIGYFSDVKKAWNHPDFNRFAVVLYGGGLLVLCVGMGLGVGLGMGGAWWEVAIILGLFLTVGVVVGTLIFWLEAVGSLLKERARR